MSSASDNDNNNHNNYKASFEDISYELYPDRKNANLNKSDLEKVPWWDLITFKKNSADSFIKLRCQYKVEKALNESYLVKHLLSAIKSKGCEVNMHRNICCENCSEQVTGGYDTKKNQIVVCQNRVYSKEMVAAVISHELIHMFDYCRAKIDFTNLEHIACSEIRAANLVHCSMTNSIFIGSTGLNRVAKTHQECVKAKALSSIMTVRKGFPYEEGIEIVNKVFDRCYNDLEPFGRRIRLNSQHKKWIYRERFLYDYDTFS